MPINITNSELWAKTADGGEFAFRSGQERRSAMSEYAKQGERMEPDKVARYVSELMLTARFMDKVKEEPAKIKEYDEKLTQGLNVLIKSGVSGKDFLEAVQKPCRSASEVLSDGAEIRASEAIVLLRATSEINRVLKDLEVNGNVDEATRIVKDYCASTAQELMFGAVGVPQIVAGL